MGYYKIYFLTLYSNKIKDSLYSVYVLSKTNGKLNIRIRGIGKTKSRFNKLNLPGYLCAGMVYRKQTDSSLFLTDSEIKNNFEHLRNDMLGLNALSYICQFICFALPENFHIINLFDDILFFLNKPDIYKLDKLNLFRFYIIFKLGYVPEIKNCSSCNSVIENNAYLDIDNSEIFCKNCNINNHRIIKLNSEYIKFHNELLYLLKTDLNKFYNIKLIQFKNLLEKINSSFIMNLNFKLDKSYNLLKKLYYS